MPAIQDTYSVDVRNRYDLGIPDSDEDTQEVENIDPLDQLRQLEEQKERDRLAKKELKAQQLAAKKNPKKPAARKEKEIQAPRKDGDGAQRERAPRNDNFRGRRQPGYGGRGGSNNENDQPPRRRNMNRPPREGGDGRPYYQRDNNRVEGAEGGEGRREDRPFRGGRGGYRGGRGGYRGGFRNDGRDGRGKREFDRHSASDKTSMRPHDKRDGQGPHNWGSIEEGQQEQAINEQMDQMAIDNNADAAAADAKPVAEGEAAAPAEGEKQEEVEPEEEEPIEMTLDEYKAKTEAEKKQQSFNIRKAGEGENNPEWKSFKQLKKNDDMVTKDDDEETTEYRRQNAKTHVDVNIQFNGEPKTRGGRGRGRGNFRGNNTRGGPRRNFDNNNRKERTPRTPDFQNEAEFPTLG